MGGSRPPQPVQSQSPFKGVNSSTFSFGDGLVSGGTQRVGNTLRTTASLGGGAGVALQNAGQGMALASDYLARPIEQRYQEINRGENQLYNDLRLAQQRELDRAFGQAANVLGQRGLENSTIGGAMMAQLANDAALRDASLRQDVVGQYENIYGNRLGILGGLNAGLVDMQMGPAQLANSNYMGAMQDISQNNMFNAGQANQFALARWQQQQANRQRMQQMIGSALGTAVTLGTMGLGAPIGASMMAGSAGNAIGGNILGRLY